MHKIKGLFIPELRKSKDKYLFKSMYSIILTATPYGQS